MLQLLAEGAIVHYQELPIPAIAYGIIALGIFMVLGIVTLSYKDVSNRHSHVDASEANH